MGTQLLENVQHIKMNNIITETFHYTLNFLTVSLFLREYSV